MVAVVSGNGLGLFTTSLAQLGLAGGGPSIGGSRTDQYVNLATGNLVLTGWDESLFGHGFATGLVRTYNSQGSFAQTGTDGWQTGYERTVRLASGTKNTVGSTVERATADGSVVTYTWDAARSAYVSSQGEGAHDTIVLSGSGSSAKWLWTEGGTQVQETYTASSLAVAGKLEKIVDLATKATYTLSYSGTLLQSVTGTNGETLTFGYDDQNRLISLGTSERDVGGVLVTKGQVSYGYDAAGRLSWVQTDLTPESALDNTWDAGAPANNDGKSYRVAYTYADASSLRITGVATSDGITVAYTYDASGRIASVTQGGVADGSAQSLTYAYSAGATTVTDAAGRSWTYQYDAAGQLTAVLEPAVGGQRAVTDYSYDAAGNVVRIRQAAYAGAMSTLDTVYQYDANGNVILQRDLLGNTVVRTYSSENRVLTEARYTVPDADGLDPTHAGTVNVPGDALVTRYVYDTTNPRLLRFVIDAAGRVTETQYNASGVAQGLASMTRSFVGAMYDTSGLPVSGVPTLTEMTDWATAGRGQTARTDFSYDAQGRLSQRTDYATVSSSSGAGVLDDATSITRYTYDAQGLLRQQVAVHGVGRTVAGVAPGGSEVVDYVYDGLGRLLSTIRRSSETAANDDANTVTTTVAYVDSSRRVVTTLDSGLVRTEVRNAAGLLLSLSEAGTVAGAQVTRTAQSVYDATGRLRAVQDATGGLTYFFYDAAGRLSAAVDATGAVTKTLYDAIGRVSGSVSYANRVATTGWYSAGAVVKDELVYAAGAPALSGTQAWVQTDAANDRTATRAYDAAGRLASETDAAGLVTSYAYDGAGRLLSSTESGDGASRVKRFFYDVTDRLVATLDAGGFLVEMIYDAAGRLALTKRYATRTNNAYWQNGTLDQLRPLADAANDQVEHLLYDGRGNQVGLVDAEGYLTEFLYDEKNNQRVVKAYAKKLTGLTGSETLATLRTSAMKSPPAEPYRLTQRSFNGLGQVVVELNPEGTVTRYSYDEAGRLVRTEAGQGTSEVRENYLRYDVFGQVTGEMSGQQAADAAAMLGKSLDDPSLSEAQRESAYAQYGLRHSYDLLGRRTETVDASGAKTFYFYDAQGRQTFVVRGVKANGIANAQGEVTETRYTAFGQVGEVLVYTGRIAIAQPGVRASVQSAISTLSFVAATDARRQYAYDRRGLLTRLTDAEGVQTAMSYNAFGELAEQTTAYGTGQASTTRYAYNPRGQMNSRTEADGTALARTTTQTFDAFGRVATVTDALGSVTTLTYDRRGRQVGMSRTVSGQLESTSTVYDAFDRVVSQADARGYVTTYAHSDSARSLVVTTPEGVSVTTVHNRFGQTVTVSQALPGGGTATATTTYDRNGAVVSVLDPLGNSTGNVYDVRGLLTEATDASGRKVQYTYDAIGRQLTRVEDPGAGKLNLTTTYTYDGQGRRLDVTDASGRLTRMSYDREGRLTQVARDPNGLNLRTVTSYDAAGRVLTVTEGYGTSAATTVQYAYDALNRRVAETVDPGTGKLNLITRYAYDANDNLVTRTDALGNLTRYAYDEAGRLRFVVDAAGALVETVYDKNGNAVLTREYAKALSAGALAALAAAPTTGALQALVTSESLLNNAADRLGYQVFDRDNRVRFTLDAAGSLTETRYDSAGRVQQSLAYGAAFTTSTVLTKLRAGTAAVSDFTGFASANESAARASQYVYDAAGRVVYALTRSDAGAVVSERRYDASGLKTADVAYAVTIPYVAGQMAAQVASALATAGGNAADQQRLTRYAYDGAGRLRFSVDDAGAVTEQRYDGADRVVSTHAYATPVTIATVTEAAVAALVAGQANVQRTGYAYDNAGRLTGTTDALNKTESYGYDAAGRRTSVTNKLGAVWTYEYDAAGRMTAERSPAVAVARYDASGNVVVSTTSIVTRRTYDALGQVLTVTENAGTAEERTVTYEYDVRGRQSRTLFPDAWQLDDNGVLAATGVQPDVRVAYDALDRAVVQKDVRGNYSYKVYDSLGRLAYDIDEAGYVTAYAYDAYGEQTGLTRYANKLNTAKLTGWTAGQAITRAQMAGSGVLTASADDRTLTTTYDRLGRKSAITQPSVAYYMADGTLATGTPTTRFEYDAYGNLVKERQLLEGTPDQADAIWADTFHYYDELGRRIRTVDAEGYVTAWQYDALGRVELQIEFARKIETAGLTTGTLPPLPAVGNAATGYDRSTLWSYDLLGRKVKESASHLYQTAAGANERRMVDTAFGYDAEGRLLTTTVDGVKVSGIAYDALGRTLSTTETEHKVLRSDWQSLLAGNANLDLSSAALYVDAAPYTTMDYDAFGNALRVVRYAGGDPASGAPNAGDAANAVTTVRYDRQGRAVATRDAVGTFWYSRYDAADNVVDAWYTLTGASGNMTVHTVASYDAIGRQLTSVTTRTPAGGGAALTDAQSAVAYNAFGEITAQGATAAALASAATSARYVYDKAGRVVASNADTGANRSYFYDLAGHQVREERPWTNDGAAATAVYLTKNDKLGRVIGQVLPSWKVDASATAQVSVSLDRWGNVLVQTDPLGNVTQYAYNDRDQVIRQTAPSVKVIDETGAERWQAPETRWMYDALGRLIATQDANGHVRRYEYDAAGQQVRVTDATGGVSRKGYDVLGREVAAQDAVGYLTYVDYDKLDHAVAQGDFLPNGSARAKTVLQSYLLDQNGGRLQTTDATGSWIKYDYDSRGLLVRSQTKAGVVRASAYDAQGRKIRETIASDSNTWVYDYFGRLTDHVDMGGSNYDYAYDARSGLLTAVTGFQPMGVMAMQGGEGSGYVMPMRQQLPPEDWPDLPPDTDLTQMPVNRRTEYYANGLVMRVTDGPITYYYEYDASGNRTLEATQTVDGAGNQVHTITRTTYDSHNRIIRVTNQDMAAGGKYTLDLSYDYDAVGNRRRVVANSAYGTNAAPLDPTNQAPVVAAPIPDQTAPANGSNWSFVVPANTFTDPEGGALTYSATGLPDWLHFDAATRTFSGVPQEAGSWSITVIAQDAKGASVTNTFTVTVTAAANQPPKVVGAIPDQSVTVGTAWSYAFPANTFSDPEGGALTYTASGRPSWMGFDANTRIFSGTPQEAGSWSITVTAQDPSGATVSDTFVVTAVVPNQPPKVVSAIPDQSATVGTAWSYAFPANTFSDPEGSALTYTTSGRPSWMGFDANTRIFSGTPQEAGSWSITVTAQDPSGATVSDTFVVTAVVPNQPPEVVNAIPDQTAYINQAWSYTFPVNTFSDPEGDALSYSYTATSNDRQGGGALWLDFNAATRTFSGTPWGDGSWTIKVTARDAAGATVTDTFVLTVPSPPNQPPTVVTPIPDQTAAVGQAWSYTIPQGAFTDPDGRLLVYTATGMPAGVTFDMNSRTFSGTPSVAGAFTVQVTAYDLDEASVTDSFVLTVTGVSNRAPVVAVPLPDKTIPVNQAWSYTIPANTFSDPDGNSLTYTAIGLPFGISFDAATRTFSGTPPMANIRTVTVRASDPMGATVSNAFVLTVAPPTNQPPKVSNAIPDQTATVGMAWSYSFPANTFSDPNGDVLTYTASGMPSGVSFDAGTRTFSGAPAATGSWNVTVTARDPSGATVSDTFVLTVIATVNHAPYVNRPLVDQVSGVGLSYTFAADTFVDPDGDTLTYTCVPPASGILFNAATRTFSGSAAGGIMGRDYVITVTASDGHGQSISASFMYHAMGSKENPNPGPLPPGFPGGGGVFGLQASPSSNDLYSALSASSLQVELDQQALPPPGEDDPPGGGGGGGGNPPAPKVPNVQTLWFSYDAENRVQVVNGALVNGQIVVAGKQANSDVESYALHYDAAGHAVSRTTVTSWGATQVAQSTYTLRGQLELEYAAVNVGQTTGVVAKHTYDAAGREIELTEYFAPGKTESYKYKAYDPETGEMYYDTMYVDVSGWRSHQTKTTYDADGRVLQVSELGRSSISNWYRDAPDPALTALSTVFYSTALGGSGYNSAGMLVTYRYQNLTSGYMHTYTTTYLKRDTYLEQSVKGVSDQQNYQTTTTTSTYDQMGRRVKIVQTTPIKNQSPLTQTRSFSFDASGGILTRRDGGVTQHYVYVNGQQVATLGEDGKIDAASQLTAFDSSQMGTEPAMVLEGDTLQSIAQRVYGNGSLWYVLAAANAVTDAELVAGSTLKVPSVKTTANDATTFKPFDPNQIQGSTTPSLPYITPPPKHHCNALATVLMVVVAIVVTVYTAGAASFAMSGLTTAATTGQMVAAAAIGAAAGSVASQAVGSLMGVTSFSWRGVAASAITGAITAGVGSLGSIGDAIKVGGAAGWGKAAGLALANAGANYAGQKLAGMDVSFSWASIAASAVSSVASAKIAPLAVEKLGLQSPFAKDFAYGMSGGLVSGAVRSSFGQTLNGSDYLTITADAFGNALANASSRVQANAGESSDDMRQRWAIEDEQMRQQMIADEEWGRGSQALPGTNTRGTELGVGSALEPGHDAGVARFPVRQADGGLLWDNGVVTYPLPPDPVIVAEYLPETGTPSGKDWVSDGWHGYRVGAKSAAASAYFSRESMNQYWTAAQENAVTEGSFLKYAGAGLMRTLGGIGYSAADTAVAVVNDPGSALKGGGKAIVNFGPEAFNGLTNLTKTAFDGLTLMAEATVAPAGAFDDFRATTPYNIDLLLPYQNQAEVGGSLLANFAAGVGLAKYGSYHLKFELPSPGTLYSNPIPVRLVSPRYLPGMVTVSGDLKRVSGVWLDAATPTPIPSQVGDALVGMKFNTFDDLRSAIWEQIGGNPELNSGFTPRNVQLMRDGYAPRTPPQYLNDNGAFGKGFNLHHVDPIKNGGAVYDLSNLQIVSPKAHYNIHY
ncbi:putative Ig domain-containing protein [Thermomonas brevis]|uniref:Putative Ig domain-containing protein n=1 Tax=Thermomonas brevis TaxID=215691 RepID=A0A7G9QS88_9GAMM|nr:putative Ig domain-containing protein [Thermomonas brevis]QNN46213.1 putative Ig domain-containing protein [Thermomonas brevis]